MSSSGGSDWREEAAYKQRIREFLSDFFDEAELAEFTDQQLPTVRTYNDIRHGDRLRGAVGTWHVIDNPVLDAVVDIHGWSNRIVILSDVIGSTLTACHDGCVFFVLGNVINSKIRQWDPERRFISQDGCATNRRLWPKSSPAPSHYHRA